MKGVDPQHVSARFGRSIESYESQAIAQENAAEFLLDTLSEFPEIQYDRVLEVGACTGRMSESLCHRKKIKTYYVNDLVDELCNKAAKRIGPICSNVLVLPGNIEEIELPQDCDLIISSSTFQWLTDFSHCMERFSQALQTKGYLIFSLFSKGTMRQVKELTGVGLDYLSCSQLTHGIEPWFEILYSDRYEEKLYFSTPRDVLRHIQLTGVSGIRNFRWTPSALRKFEQRYCDEFQNAKGVPVDYVSTLVVARKRGGWES